MKYLVAITIAITLFATLTNAAELPIKRVADNSANNIKVSIATGAPLDPPKDHFRAGEEIAVAITMTNTSTEPVYVCVTSPLYQDMPTLSRNGQTIPYMNWQEYERKRSEADGTCSKESLPEPMLLNPGEPTMVDWFILSDNASLVTDGWYDPLPRGQYELSLKRRINCCDGTMVESNKVSFEVN